MENEENQNQVSLRFPPPLEIAPRFPQSHNPDDDSLLAKTQNQKARKEPQRLKKPQPPSSGSSFDEKMLCITGRDCPMRQRNLNREIEPTCGLSHPSEGTHEPPPFASPRTQSPSLEAIFKQPEPNLQSKPASATT